MLHKQVAVPMGFDGYALKADLLCSYQVFVGHDPEHRSLNPSQRTGVSDLRLYAPIGGRGMEADAAERVDATLQAAINRRTKTIG
jgi:hypothetical protein